MSVNNIEHARGAPPTPLRLMEIGPNHPRREDVEGIIRKRYWQEHGARITRFFPNLLALDDSDGALAGTAGYRIASEAGDVVFCVADDGPGIPRSMCQRVFDRFVRLPARQGEGSGLGLSIVQRIAQLHGAGLSLDARPSSASGSGLVFTARFPVAGSENEQGAP